MEIDPEQRLDLAVGKSDVAGGIKDHQTVGQALQHRSHLIVAVFEQASVCHCLHAVVLEQLDARRGDFQVAVQPVGQSTHVGCRAGLRRCRAALADRLQLPADGAQRRDFALEQKINQRHEQKHGQCE